MTQERPVTVVCQYRIRPGHEAEFEALLARHWPALHAAGLVSDTPPQHLRGRSADQPDGRTGGEREFVEIFEWKTSGSAHAAHGTPEVQAIWEPMGAICVDMSFPHFDAVTPQG